MNKPAHKRKTTHFQTIGGFRELVRFSNQGSFLGEEMQMSRQRVNLCVCVCVCLCVSGVWLCVRKRESLFIGTHPFLLAEDAEHVTVWWSIFPSMRHETHPR